MRPSLDRALPVSASGQRVPLRSAIARGPGAAEDPAFALGPPTGTRGNEGDLGARRQPADCLSSPSTAADMGSEDDNNRVTRIMFEHGQDEPVIHSRMLQMIEREVSPMQTLLLEKLCNFLLSDTLTRNFAVCSALSPPSI